MRGDDVRRISRRGSIHLVIDFRYLDAHGRRARFRRDAVARSIEGARLEARRYMDRAKRTGNPLEPEEPPLTATPAARHQSAPAATTSAQPGKGLTFVAFVTKIYRPLFMPRLAPGTIERYERDLRLHILPWFGSTLLGEIDGMQVRRYDTHLRTVSIEPKNTVSLVKGILRAAVDAGELAALPQGMPKYKPAKKIPQCPTAEELRLVLEHCGGWLRLRMHLIVYAGLRVSEARALQVGDVDLVRGVITVRRTFSGDKDGGVLQERTKGKDDRVVPIAEPLRPLLAEAVRSKLPAAPILLTQDGRIPRRQAVYGRLVEAATRAGLPPMGPHKGRHGFCSWLLSASASVEAVRLLAGHSNLETTSRYLHAHDRELRDAITRLA
jgi:integrase